MSEIEVTLEERRIDQRRTGKPWPNLKVGEIGYRAHHIIVLSVNEKGVVRDWGTVNSSPVSYGHIERRKVADRRVSEAKS